MVGAIKGFFLDDNQRLIDSNQTKPETAKRNREKKTHLHEKEGQKGSIQKKHTKLKTMI
jgi:hypothetical protein